MSAEAPIHPQMLDPQLQGAGQTNGQRGAPTLASALHQARIENAERSQVITELRSAEIARLQMMQEALLPILDEVPKHVDIFDCALAEADHPRLFLDMIAFIEMARDLRTYRFVQDTRYGRLVLAESEKFDIIVNATRNYIARRLVERQSALASDQTVEQAGRQFQQRNDAANKSMVISKPQRGNWLIGWLKFVIEFVGVFVLTALVLWGAYSANAPMRRWLAAHRPPAEFNAPAHP